MIWDQLTSEEIGQLDKNIPVVLPMAATEQHGTHLPLATDRMIGEHFSTELHKVIPDNVLILPIVAVGCSDHHMDFEGTLTLRHDTFGSQVQDIVRSVIHHGFRKIVLLNSHGGNQGIGQVLIEQLGDAHPDCHIAMVTWWKIAMDNLLELNETGFGGVGHAGEFETSLMLLIAPELVRKEKIAPGANTNTFDWAAGDMLRGPAASYYQTMKEMTPNGTFGDPTNATKEKGILITQYVIQSLKKIITDFSKIS
ncbi:creatininase family protein [Fulvivirgaceae bacterium BMA10]|uniref:Creatininase family protein n=1 Tax=Splendidivirga corallicola TaxID=3051826 RepID=A0ABT8KHT6_9BACT|nr:creatininase family protein [Fulvivirgaceae bacterium BMA10]